MTKNSTFTQSFQKIIMLSVFILFACNLVIAQENTPASEKRVAQQGRFIVKGRVVGDSGPLSGVSVSEKGGKSRVTSDSSGYFTLPVSSANGTLVFSYIGYDNLEIPINGKPFVMR